ncbi:hypothetical protein AXK56_12765 [Tsukamurella pulmonis]|uniref:Uncharacterized protein n=1 Tax=Tsukamurella pulmonis TaxID=47312 RepID=A0A1H1GV03_9ACTN|nr:condensation domain-containing protein [Tsukamurella pulmonis]KXO88229.1 hypothetical protein AXK56_12765 [Tsukamurella pulmonis]SDR17052.1 hypothetical protein SAMN04489765_3597 [Tsukamurella pulmonis]SUP16533.1 SL659 acyltransferase papA1 [Tsukamurella pulmonis]
MIGAALDDWRPPQGTLIDFTATVGAGEQPADVGPTFLQAEHLAAAEKAERHTAYIGFAADVRGRADVAALTAAVTDFVRAHESLRTRFVRAGDGWERLVTPAEAITVAAVDAGPAPDGPELTARLRGRFSEEATAWRVPGAVIGAIAGEDSFGLYVAADHSATDGASLLLGLNEIIVRYRAHREGTSAPLPSALAPHSHVARTERDRTAATDPSDPALQVWRRAFTATGGGLERLPIDTGLEPGASAPVQALHHRLLDTDQVAALEASVAPARLSAALYAALAITDHARTGSDTWMRVVVQDLRREFSSPDADLSLTQGWVVGFAPLLLEGLADKEPAQVIADAGEAVRAARRAGAIPTAAALGVLFAEGTVDPAAVTRPPLISYLDARPVASALPEVASSMMFPGDGSTANVSLWLTRESGGLEIGAQCPDTATATAEVARYAEDLRATLATFG